MLRTLVAAAAAATRTEQNPESPDARCKTKTSFTMSVSLIVTTAGDAQAFRLSPSQKLGQDFPDDSSVVYRVTGELTWDSVRSHEPSPVVSLRHLFDLFQIT